MYWRICIVFRIYEVCLVWLQSVLADCICLLNTPLKCKYLSRYSNHFFFTPIMKLVLSTLKKISREENFTKVTKILLRLLNKRSWELSHENSKIKILREFNAIPVEGGV